MGHTHKVLQFMVCRMPRYSVLLCLLLFLKEGILAQAITGIPIIKNFPKSEYQASTQNWSICQGSEGYMYFGNNQGVLQYTGYDWQLVEMANYSIVRCVQSGGEDTIFVGAFNELGLLSHDNTGQPRFTSWNSKIPDKYRNYGEIWRIHNIGNISVFQAFKSMLVFKRGDFYKAIVPGNEFRFSYLIGNDLYIQEKGKGLLRFTGDTLVLVKGGEFFSDKEIWSLFEFSPNQLLIGTQHNGFYTYNEGSIKPWATPASQFVIHNTLFNGIKLDNNRFAFGTVLNGLIITDSAGNIMLRLNKQSGIQNNTVLAVYQDCHRNIWLGLDNGIDYVKTSIPISFVRKGDGFGTGYCALVFGNKLYAGTNQGLFACNLMQNSGIDQDYQDFRLIPHTEGQVWGLFSLDGNLLCGHNAGLFVIRNNIATQIFDECGVWDVKPIPNWPNMYIVGTYYGYYLLQRKNQDFKIVAKILNFDESARRFFFDDYGFIWLSHGYKGIYQLKLSPDCQSISLVKVYNSSNDLPLDHNNDVAFVWHRVVATTETGVYEFNYAKGKFEPSAKWDEFLNGDTRQLTRIIATSERKIWAFKRGSIKLLTYLNDRVFDLNTRSFLMLNGTLSRSYENVLEVEKNKYLLGTEDGFVLYNDIETLPDTTRIPLTIGWISSIRGDNRAEATERIALKDPATNSFGAIPYRKRHLRVNLSMPYFPSQALVKYRYRVNNGEWGSWFAGNTLDLNGLPEKYYQIDIQCSIDEKEIAGVTQLCFEILPPIQRTWYAYLAYVVTMIAGIATLLIYIRRRIAYEKRKEYLTQRKKLIAQGIKMKQKAQEAENEINILKNEKLQADIIYKSKELANITMSIIQKNLILNEIKDNLQDLIDENASLKHSSKVVQLVRKINKGIEQKDEWKVFEQNFDQVHENFLNHLKEKHPDLSAKDMRLAAYIRMNLSSKEIAPLMNISVRSVEISRYRLRKKINIEHDKNLYSYLINL